MTRSSGEYIIGTCPFHVHCPLKSRRERAIHSKWKHFVKKRDGQNWKPFYNLLFGIYWLRSYLIWLHDKEYACQVGVMGSIPGLDTWHGVGNGNPLQYSCLGNFMDRGAWWATLQSVGHDLVTKQQQRNRKEMLNVTEEVSISIELILEKNNRSTN